jgi:hypothetical protein
MRGRHPHGPTLPGQLAGLALVIVALVLTGTAIAWGLAFCAVAPK